jgi:hypothetical protein
MCRGTMTDGAEEMAGGQKIDKWRVRERRREERRMAGTPFESVGRRCEKLK